MKNLRSVDYLKAFSMLYIVGYWHLFNYTGVFPGYKNTFTNTVTFIVLGLFVLISGFLIGRKEVKSSLNSNSIVNFYKKRLVRIYPLYFLSVIIFYIYGINDAETSIKSLFFISMYYGPSPLTLWFITMLFIFYLAAPFLLGLVNNQVKFLLFIGLIMFITAVFLVIFRTVDSRLLLYFPCFCIGIYISQYGLETKFINIKTALLLLFLGLPPFFIEINSWTLTQLKYLPIILSSSYLIFAISYINEDKFKEKIIVSILSYSSFTMYLFHRPIFITMKSLYFPVDGSLQVLYLLTACLFIIFLISWSLQKLYDWGLIIANK